jgi:hypothetical protein
MVRLVYEGYGMQPLVEYVTGTRISPAPEKKAGEGEKKISGDMSTTTNEQSFHISAKSNALILSLAC